MAIDMAIDRPLVLLTNVWGWSMGDQKEKDYDCEKLWVFNIPGSQTSPDASF